MARSRKLIIDFTNRLTLEEEAVLCQLFSTYDIPVYEASAYDLELFEEIQPNHFVEVSYTVELSQSILRTKNKKNQYSFEIISDNNSNIDMRDGRSILENMATITLKDGTSLLFKKHHSRIIKAIPLTRENEDRSRYGIENEFALGSKNRELLKIKKPIYIEEDNGDHADIIANAFLVMRKITGQDLTEFIRTLKGRSRLEKRLKIFNKLLQEIKTQLYAQGIIHRDIKGENIIINPETLELIFIDYELGREEDKNVTENRLGTKEYMAFEVFAENTTSRQSDFYSLGMLFKVLLCGDLPEFDVDSLKSDEDIQKIISILNAEMGKHTIKKGIISEYQYKKEIYDGLNKLINSILTRPEKRLTVDEAQLLLYEIIFLVADLKAVDKGLLEKINTTNQAIEDLKRAPHGEIETLIKIIDELFASAEFNQNPDENIKIFAMLINCSSFITDRDWTFMCTDTDPIIDNIKETITAFKTHIIELSNLSMEAKAIKNPEYRERIEYEINYWQTRINKTPADIDAIFMLNKSLEKTIKHIRKDIKIYMQKPEAERKPKLSKTPTTTSIFTPSSAAKTETDINLEKQSTTVPQAVKTNKNQ